MNPRTATTKGTQTGKPPPNSQPTRFFQCPHDGSGVGVGPRPPIGRTGHGAKRSHGVRRTTANTAVTTPPTKRPSARPRISEIVGGACGPPRATCPTCSHGRTSPGHPENSASGPQTAYVGHASPSTSSRHSRTLTPDAHAELPCELGHREPSCRSRSSFPRNDDNHDMTRA
jgi:hypothetical protein